MTRDISQGIERIQPMDWSSHFNPKDIAELDLRKPVSLDLDIDPKETGKSTGYFGHEIISINPKRSFEGLELPHDTSPKGIQEVNADLMQFAEKKRKREQQEEYERYFKDTVVSLDPKKAKTASVAIEKKSVSSIAIDTTPDTQPTSPKPLAVEESLAPIKPKGFSVSGIFDWVVSIFKPSAKADATSAAALGKPENVISNVPKLTPPEQANMEKVLKYIEQMNEDLKRIQEIAKEESNTGTLPQNAEAYYLSLLIARVKDQARIKETQMLADNDRMVQSQKEIKEAQAKYYDIQKAIAERAKTDKLLGWVVFTGTLTMLGMAALTGGLFVASFFTGGATLAAAIPAAMATIKTGIAVIGAVAAVTTGASQIAQAVLQQKTKDQQAEASGLVHQRERAQEEIKACMQDWSDSMKALGKSWEDISSVIKGRHQTINQMMS